MRRENIILGFLLAVFLTGISFASTMTIRPNAQGYYADWSNTGCSSGTSEWQCVDENPANTSDYLYTNAASKYESFAFQDTGLNGVNINSVTLHFYAKRYNSNRYQFQPLIRSNSTNYLGSVKSTTASYADYSQAYNTNPATGSAWTRAEVDALESGMKSYTSSYGGYVAQVYAVVDYSYPDSCSDTDGGNVITTYGTTSGYLNSTYYSHNDYCVDASNINEYFCSGTSEQSSQQSCGTDGYVGSNYCLSGDVYKDYTDYYCAGGACGSNTTAILQQDCTAGQYCSAGQCLYSDSCSDTDGGNVITTYGTTSGYLNSTYYSHNDYCVDASNINEYFCSGTAEQSSQQSCGTDGYTGSNYCLAGDVYKDYTDYYCAGGACSSNTSAILQQDCTAGQYCSAGQCLYNNTCSDTDGGFVVTQFGTTSGYLNLSYYSHDDYCLDNLTLVENFCSGSYSYSYSYDCNNGNSTTLCYLGACV